MHLRRIGLSAAAVAAGLPTLLAGMVVAPAPRLLVGPDDSTVRTQLVADPPPQPSDPSLGLTGAHPPTDPVGMGGQGAGGALDPAQDDNRGVPVRVSGTALPARVLLAYRDAAAALHLSDPACNLSWTLIAGIGKVESGHASGGAVDKAGHTLRPILGPELNGVGPVAAIADSDGGRWDGDTTWDRAVGPMQFIPTSWAVWGQDGDADGTADPSDVDDAALATASYLCAGDRDLSQDKDRRSAVFSYNHSWDYVDLVLAWADAYATGTPVQTASLTGGAGGAGSGTGTSGGGTGASAPPGTAVALPPAGPITSPAAGGAARRPGTRQPGARWVDGRSDGSTGVGGPAGHRWGDVRTAEHRGHSVADADRDSGRLPDADSDPHGRPDGNADRHLGTHRDRVAGPHRDRDADAHREPGPDVDKLPHGRPDTLMLGRDQGPYFSRSFALKSVHLIETRSTAAATDR